MLELDSRHFFRAHLGYNPRRTKICVPGSRDRDLYTKNPPLFKCESQKDFSKNKNYFTSSDPHHDMLGGGCQVRVVIENMMGRMENLRTLISGFLGLVILVRWALVTMFLS